jgi:hypothetical protein
MYSVTRHSDSKLNQLFHLLPVGLVVDAAWLERHGYSRSLRSQYVATGWLEQPTRRVYRRPQGTLSWEAVVISLQTLLDVPLVLGGHTALQIQGLSHYMSNAVRDVHLYGPATLPTWIRDLPLPLVRFHHHNNERLFRNDPISRGLTSMAWDLDKNSGWSTDSLHGFRQITWSQWDWPLTLSTPERALLELLDELPSRESFEYVDKLVEGMANLSPRRMSKLLADCKSVKVKRLFFFFADRHPHAWRKRLDPKDYDLGSGNRSLVSGGRLDPTYRITVPEEFHGLR